jgi:Zn finger protein HypA/HybF involved in hydrogenase expression
MRVLKCPDCDNFLDIYVGILRPWEAVEAEMLEKGVILHCPSCHTRNFDITDIICPQCNEKKLQCSLLDQLVIQQIPQKLEGKIKCTNCEFKIHV